MSVLPSRRPWGRVRIRPASHARIGAAAIALLARTMVLTVGLATVLAMMVTSLGTPTAAARARTSGWLTTSGSQLRTADGKPYLIKAVSWFGMETANCAPHGLWQIGLDDGMAQIASFGFNTVRLPYSNECLAARATSGIDAVKNPGLVGRTPLQVMDAVVASARAHGLSVILDRHRPDSGSQSALWYTRAWPESRWISDWTMLAQRYRNDPTVIGADLHNEPHAPACWSCGDPALDWSAAATRAGNAVLAANPHLLIIVEGVDRQEPGGGSPTTWWGGGLAGVAAHPVELDVAHRVVYSPHDYPSSIYSQPWFSAPHYPANLDAFWTANWGYLVQRDIAPVWVGEFGTRLQTASDRQWLDRLVSYLKTNKISFGYWSFNPNSGDTGGLVADDWVSPERAKLAALAPILGGGDAVPPGPTSPVPPAPMPTSSTPAPPAQRDTSTNPPTNSPTGTAPEPGASTTGPSTPVIGPGGLTAAWQLDSAWQSGYVAQFRLTAQQASEGWTLRWPDRDATAVANAWGMHCRVADGQISCTGADWSRSIPAGESVTVGLQVNSTGTAPHDPPLTLG